MLFNITTKTNHLEYESICLQPRSRGDISRIKSKLNHLVEEANSRDKRILFPALDQYIRDRKYTRCSHHMISCARIDDSMLELLYHCKAVESSTTDNHSGELIVHLMSSSDNQIA